MALSSSRSWRYNVFLSFHGPDVRSSYLSHLRKQFERNGIITFNDQEIERSQTIKPELTRAIQESRISIVVLSQNYASSSWCLNELVEILDCKETGQIVMTVFYKVNPSDVRKQIGGFGKAFKETCQGKTETEIQSWTKALTYVANIEGEHSLNWVNEADLIEKIATDVSNKLNASLSRDFDGMVGLEDHLGKMKSLLHLENNEAMIIGISGPAGIGKTTIARALFNQLSFSFPLRYFMGNVKGSYRRTDCDEHGLKLRLQEQLLRKILNQKRMKISHLNVIYERLGNQKVLIILDDVDHLEQIIVTTEDQELLQQHGINNVYNVAFPSSEEALGIFCLSAFKQISPPDGFGRLAERAAELCSNLPLGLCVVGSSLLDKSLICISTNGDIQMHKLLQQVGTQEIKRQEPWKRHILIDPYEICDVLQSNTGTGTVMGISFDITEISKVSISKKTFRRMCNLRFLRVYKRRIDKNVEVHIPEEMEFPHGLRLLHWKAYPSKCLPPTFHPEYLVELNMQHSQLEKLWEGTQPLTNLTKMNLSGSGNLKEVPDLSNAKNLELLDLSGCMSLVEIPSSISNLHKLQELMMMFCINLEVIPEGLNLMSIETVNMVGCLRLRTFTPSFMSFNLRHIFLTRCEKLQSLPDIVSTELITLNVNGCQSLQRVPNCFHSTKVALNFTKCFNLSQEARKSIIQRSFLDGRKYVGTRSSNKWARLPGWACLPGNEVPAEFNHRAKGNSLTILPESSDKPLYASAIFKICIVISPKNKVGSNLPKIICLRMNKFVCSCPCYDFQVYNKISMSSVFAHLSTEHLFVFLYVLDQKDHSLGVLSEILFKIESGPNFEITECGAQMWTEETPALETIECGAEETENVDEGKSRRSFWSCLLLCCFIVCCIVIFAWGKKTIDF
ncbi:unnamed protein product [Brassica napus]|uniref:(rape) hypothetical protein n=1 Tax=Brassica napus TaxID=3708 RepID=A0A816NTG6_BRANA|nr:unnamed protein product [Brassica napus]